MEPTSPYPHYKTVRLRSAGRAKRTPVSGQADIAPPVVTSIANATKGSSALGPLSSPGPIADPAELELFPFFPTTTSSDSMESRVSAQMQRLADLAAHLRREADAVMPDPTAELPDLDLTPLPVPTVHTAAPPSHASASTASQPVSVKASRATSPINSTAGTLRSSTASSKHVHALEAWLTEAAANTPVATSRSTRSVESVDGMRKGHHMLNVYQEGFGQAVHHVRGMCSELGDLLELLLAEQVERWAVPRRILENDLGMLQARLQLALQQEAVHLAEEEFITAEMEITNALFMSTANTLKKRRKLATAMGLEVAETTLDETMPLFEAPPEPEPPIPAPESSDSDSDIDSQLGPMDEAALDQVADDSVVGESVPQEAVPGQEHRSSVPAPGMVPVAKGSAGLPGATAVAGKGGMPSVGSAASFAPPGVPGAPGVSAVDATGRPITGEAAGLQSVASAGAMDALNRAVMNVASQFAEPVAATTRRPPPPPTAQVSTDEFAGMTTEQLEAAVAELQSTLQTIRQKTSDIQRRRGKADEELQIGKPYRKPVAVLDETGQEIVVPVSDDEEDAGPRGRASNSRQSRRSRSRSSSSDSGSDGGDGGEAGGAGGRSSRKSRKDKKSGRSGKSRSKSKGSAGDDSDGGSVAEGESGRKSRRHRSKSKHRDGSGSSRSRSRSSGSDGGGGDGDGSKRRSGKSRSGKSKSKKSSRGGSGGGGDDAGDGGSVSSRRRRRDKDDSGSSSSEDEGGKSKKDKKKKKKKDKKDKSRDDASSVSGDDAAGGEDGGRDKSSKSKKQSKKKKSKDRDTAGGGDDGASVGSSSSSGSDGGGSRGSGKRSKKSKKSKKQKKKSRDDDSADSASEIGSASGGKRERRSKSRRKSGAGGEDGDAASGRGSARTGDDGHSSSDGEGGRKSRKSRKSKKKSKDKNRDKDGDDDGDGSGSDTESHASGGNAKSRSSKSKSSKSKSKSRRAKDGDSPGSDAGSVDGDSKDGDGGHREGGKSRSSKAKGSRKSKNGGGDGGGDDGDDGASNASGSGPDAEADGGGGGRGGGGRRRRGHREGGGHGGEHGGHSDDASGSGGDDSHPGGGSGSHHKSRKHRGHGDGDLHEPSMGSIRNWDGEGGEDGGKSLLHRAASAESGAKMAKGKKLTRAATIGGGSGGGRSKEIGFADSAKFSGLPAAVAKHATEASDMILGTLSAEARKQLASLRKRMNVSKLLSGVRYRGPPPYPLQWLRAQLHMMYAERELMLRANVAGAMLSGEEDPPSMAMTMESAISRVKTKLRVLLRFAGAAGFMHLASHDANQAEEPLSEEQQAELQRQTHLVLKEFAELQRNADWERMDNFVADYYQRKYGLPSIADRHVSTFARCVKAYKTSPHVELFIKFLEEEYDTDSLKFFLVVSMLARDGIPGQYSKLVRTSTKMSFSGSFRRPPSAGGGLRGTGSKLSVMQEDTKDDTASDSDESVEEARPVTADSLDVAVRPWTAADEEVMKAVGTAVPSTPVSPNRGASSRRIRVPKEQSEVLKVVASAARTFSQFLPVGGTFASTPTAASDGSGSTDGRPASRAATPSNKAILPIRHAPAHLMIPSETAHSTQWDPRLKGSMLTTKPSDYQAWWNVTTAASFMAQQPRDVAVEGSVQPAQAPPPLLSGPSETNLLSDSADAVPVTEDTLMIPPSSPLASPSRRPGSGAATGHGGLLVSAVPAIRSMRSMRSVVKGMLPPLSTSMDSKDPTGDNRPGSSGPASSRSVSRTSSMRPMSGGGGVSPSRVRPLSGSGLLTGRSAGEGNAVWAGLAAARTVEWTRWSSGRLDALVIANCREVLKAGLHYLASTRANVFFPEMDNGADNWVPLTRARQLCKLLLLPKDAEALDGQLVGMAETGWVPAWDRLRLPAHLIGVFTETPRIDRDLFAQLMLQARQAAKFNAMTTLQQLFEEYDKDHDQVIQRSEFISAISKGLSDTTTSHQAGLLFDAAMKEQATTYPKATHGLRLDVYMKTMVIYTSRLELQ